MTHLAAAVLGLGIVHGKGRRPADLAGPLPYPLPAPDISELAEHFPESRLRRVPRLVRLGLLGAHRALADAGNPAPQPMGLVVGSAHCAIATSLDYMDSLLDDGPRLSSPTAFSHSVCNVGAGLLGMLLDIQGPTHTVSQFGLSFAGALTAAMALLRTRRADRVLAGVIEETDSRLAGLCPDIVHATLPLAEGAAFLCLARPEDAPSAPRLEALWNPPDDAIADTVLLSGTTARDRAGQRMDTAYGHTPMAQALDVAIALAMPDGNPIVTCLCESSSHRALVTVKRNPAQ